MLKVLHRHIRESEFYPTSEFLIRFSAEHYNARHLAFSSLHHPKSTAMMVRHGQYCSCNGETRSLEQLKTSNDVELQMAFSKSVKKDINMCIEWIEGF